MSTVFFPRSFIVVPLSKAFVGKSADQQHVDQYEADLGISYDDLLTKVTKGYIRLWKNSYKDDAAFERLLAHEGLDDFEATRNRFAAFADPDVKPEDYQKLDNMQTGADRAMFVAIEKKTSDVHGLLQISSFNYSNFLEQTPDALTDVYNKVCRHLRINKNHIDMQTAFAEVSKLQRYHYDPAMLRDRLLYSALRYSTHDPKSELTHNQKTSLLLISHQDTAECKSALNMGFETVAESRTMDSAIPCHYMLAERGNVVKYMEEKWAQKLPEGLGL